MPLTTTRPTRQTPDLHRVHRLESPFPLAYLCHALWGACYAATTPHQLLRTPVLLAVAANLIPLIAQNVLNAAMDIPIDARTPGKSGVARAAQRLGRRRLFGIATAEMTLALLLACGVAVHLGRPLIAAGVAAGILVEYLYNLEPVRLKKRGLANPISLGAHFSVLPCLSTFNAVRPDFPGYLWPLFLGLWLLLIGRTLWWSLPDAPADQAAGLTPPAVRYGTSRALVLAVGATATALTLIAWGLAWSLGPGAALLGTTGCGIFLISKLRLTPATLHALHETRMRRHTLTFVIGADVLLVALPLAGSVLGQIANVLR
ncbi:UbiA family prenyltransferase [Streptomyces sp. NPDC094437]|uniref:UbiA family prenyltransferase n=1 Tax=Streptomyces sp. NPDC094437 TaxID=3366060 RepID=UPI00381C1206